MIACFAAAGVWGTDYLTGSEPASDAARSPSATRVTVEAPETRELEDRFSAVGTILPNRSIDLRPLAAGRVVNAPATSGSQVAKGDLIFELDDRVARAELANAQASFDEARLQLQRFQELEERNVSAAAQIQTARAAFLRAEAALQLAKANLADRRLIAPFDGVLGTFDLDPGEYIEPATIVSTLADLSSVEAEFALPERYFAMTREGQTVRLEASPYPDRVFVGEVDFVSPGIEPASRSFDVRVLIENADRALAGGMFVDAQLVFDTYRALTVRDEAVISEGSANYVYTAVGDEARRTDVTLGSSRQGRTEIVEGLDESARVVVTGWDTLSDGSPIEIVPIEIAVEDASEEARQ
ncbi:efflux RND transporter periplasmic adaptor subunit [Fulvimarina sp. 2208YS6-2-32]|uniref:Efflux RND transporter periplasmic adaptor subunit n=1 Tax=Fulvimarina uroteuthidis TaxID=3098149 RepID=A0ABU5I3P6_9HYPH|nr:efflux RND transporter periplasmic adaptor subunit [Fulvimarina sp. 2208YS6-2-32]MDY8109388.1 efflux RND transporter periplasmic adaptor subunit [Fulvimarina sp. 2208YS6-2-32]